MLHAEGKAKIVTNNLRILSVIVAAVFVYLSVLGRIKVNYPFNAILISKHCKI
jgi:hypothetical protein